MKTIGGGSHDPRRQTWPPGSLLGGLADDERRALLALGTLREYEPGSVLLREADRSTHVLLLLDGFVKITASTADGKLALLAIRVGGDVIGEMAALDGAARIATATAAGAVLARVVSQHDFHVFLERHPLVSVAISSAVVAKLRWATRRRVDFGALEVRVRLARVLLELLDSYGENTTAGRHIGVSLTQPELAALIAASEPAVHKVLADLRSGGILATGYRRLIVKDIPSLRRLARSGD
jgi:CRP-like cAMP-binding protein